MVTALAIAVLGHFLNCFGDHHHISVIERPGKYAAVLVVLKAPDTGNGNGLTPVVPGCGTHPAVARFFYAAAASVAACARRQNALIRNTATAHRKTVVLLT